MSLFEWCNLKPPFLRDTENGRNSRNRGVENGKWQVSFSEMIQLIFTHNLSQFGRAFKKMLGKVYLFPTFPSNCHFICLLGSYFCSLNALFGSPVWGNVCRAAILFVYTWRSVSRTLQIFPRFSNFNLLIQKNGKFWSVCTVFDRKRKNTENGKSTKRNLNFVKRRNGGLSVTTYICDFPFKYPIYLPHSYWGHSAYVILRHTCLLLTHLT